METISYLGLINKKILLPWRRDEWQWSCCWFFLVWW